MLILGLLAFGMLIGWVAGLILGQGTKLSGRTLIAGLVGSFVGGLLVSLLSGDGLKLKPSGLIGSVVGAIIVARDLGRSRSQDPPGQATPPPLRRPPQALTAT